MDAKNATPAGAKGLHETYPLALKAVRIGTKGWSQRADALVDLLIGDGKKRPPTAVPKGHDAIIDQLVNIANNRKCGVDLGERIGDAMAYVRAEEKRHADKPGAAPSAEALLPTSPSGAATTNEVEAHAARVADRRDGKPASTENTAVEDKNAAAAGETATPSAAPAAGSWNSGFGGEVAADETRDVTHSAEKRGGIVA